MLLKVITLKAIVAGDVSLVFRRWKRPGVKTGTRLRTAVGELLVESVDAIEFDAISVAEAANAGWSLPDLREELSRREGTVYRIAVSYAGPDARDALREKTDLSDTESADLRKRLQRMDKNGAWTQAALLAIRERSATRAPDLAEEAGVEVKLFKRRIRRLKELGLTRSLKVGYELSPRGEVVLDTLY